MSKVNFRIEPYEKSDHKNMLGNVEDLLRDFCKQNKLDEKVVDNAEDVLNSLEKLAINRTIPQLDKCEIKLKVRSNGGILVQVSTCSKEML